MTCYFLWHRRPAAGRVFRISLGVPSFCLFIYAFAATISILYAPSARYEGLLEAARLFLWVTLAWCFSELNAIQWLTIAKLSTISAAVIAFTVLLEAFGHRIWVYSGVWMGPIGHVSYFGDFMALHLPLCVYLLATNHDCRRKSIWGLSLLLILAGLWLSGTRASMVGVMAGLFFGLVVLIKIVNFPWWKTLSVLGIFIGLILLMNWALPHGPRGQSPLNRIKQAFVFHMPNDTSTGGRSHIYANTVQMIRERPLLGWGLGSFRFNYPEFDHRSDQPGDVSASTWLMHPHNEILNQWAEVGLPGLLAFLFGFGFLYVNGLRRMRSEKQSNTSSVILMALSGLTIALTSWQFSTNFLFPLSRLLTAFYLGVLWREIRPSRDLSPQIPSSKYSFSLMGVVLFCTLLLGAYQFSLYASMRGYEASSIEENKKWVDLSRRLAPGAFDSLYAYASRHLNNDEVEKGLLAVEQLHNQYPFVPVSLYLTAMSRLRTGRAEEAKDFLRHALANDPSYGIARNVLDGLEKKP